VSTRRLCLARFVMTNSVVTMSHSASCMLDLIDIITVTAAIRYSYTV
jgi:hypothetical protein